MSDTRIVNPTPRRTTYAVAIETRAKAIQEALGVCHYDACLERIEHIRRFCDHLEREIIAERKANPHHVEAWKRRTDVPDDKDGGDA